MHVEMPWTLDGADPTKPAHTFTAKIDRVDLLPSGAHRIADYKTGNATKALTEPKKADLQLCIYLMALMHEMSMDDIPDGAAEYWVLSAGARGVLPFASMNLDKAREQINAAAQGMLSGEFEQGKQCRGHCGILDG
jgi:RecB family exonuclease